MRKALQRANTFHTPLEPSIIPPATFPATNPPSPTLQSFHELKLAWLIFLQKLTLLGVNLLIKHHWLVISSVGVLCRYSILRCCLSIEDCSFINKTPGILDLDPSNVCCLTYSNLYQPSYHLSQTYSKTQILTIACLIVVWRDLHLTHMTTKLFGWNWKPLYK